MIGFLGEDPMMLVICLSCAGSTTGCRICVAAVVEFSFWILSSTSNPYPLSKARRLAGYETLVSITSLEFSGSFCSSGTVQIKPVEIAEAGFSVKSIQLWYRVLEQTNTEMGCFQVVLQKHPFGKESPLK